MTALEVETDVIGVSKNLVDLLDGGTIVTTSAGGATRATGTREATRTTGHATGSTLTTSSVELHHDGVGLALELLLVLLVLLTSSLLVLVEPLDDLVNLSAPQESS